MKLKIAIILLFCCGLDVQAGTPVEDWVQRGLDAYVDGRYAESAAAFEKALELGETDPAVHYNAACSHALTGNREAAFTHLSAAVEYGYSNVQHTSTDSDLASLHEDSRWQQIMERMRLIERRNVLRWGGEAFKSVYRDDLADEEKIAGLSKIWAEAKFGFANFDKVPDLDWDARYLEFIPRVKQTKSIIDYYRVLMEFITALQDGHTNVYPPRELWSRMWAKPGFRTGLVENRVIIRAVTRPADAAAGFKAGQEILAVNGEPVKQYAAREVMPYQSASTPQDLDARTYDYQLLAGDPARRLKLKIRDLDGRERELVAARLDFEQWRALAPPAFEIEWPTERIALIRLNSFEQMGTAEMFLEHLDALRERAHGIVIDIRDNGGGNSGVGFRILAQLMDKSFITETWELPQYTAAFRAWERPQPVYGPHTGSQANAVSPYRGKVAVLIGPRTYSAAEDFAMAFDYNERGVLIGEATGGSTGQPVFFELPGGGSARICSKRNRYPNGTEFVGVGIQPDIVTPWTMEAIRSVRDPALERAMTWIDAGE